MAYTFVENLVKEFEIPEKGILSRVLQKDEHVNITLFGFSAGHEIASHSASTPATIFIVEGEAEVQLGDDTVRATSGALIYMPPQLPHAISAKTPLRMLLTQIKR
jgi:quercetin dioxygenase-like cupin family protein